MLKSKKAKIKRQNLIFKYKGIIALFIFLVFSPFCYAEKIFTYDAKGKHNPFIPLITNDGRLLKLEPEETQTGPGLSIEGVIYDKNGISYAIVNGSVVKIGDTVGGYQVLKIESRKVIFIKEGQTLEIELKKEEE